MVDREFPLDLLHALGDVGIEEHITPMPVGSALELSLQRQVAAQDGGRVLPRLTRLIATRGTARVFLVVLVPAQLGSAVALRHCNGALGSAIKSRW